MRQQKKLLVTLAVLVLVIFAGIFSTSNIKASAASNSLSATYRLMYIGQSYTAKVKGSYSSVKWSTSNSNIASVNSSGKITGVNEGRANIYATVDGKKLTLKVEVVSKAAYQAVSYANKAVGCRYSQSRRMSKGYYDCGSLVWRSYASAGVYIGGKTDWAPTAASSGSILNKAYKVVSYSSVKTSELLPGDLIFTSTRKNGRYRNITHAAIYVGNGKIVEAANSKTGVVKRNYSTKNIVLIARPTVNVSKTLQQPQMTSTKVTSSSVNNTSIKVTWNKVRGASGYYVYRKIAGTDTWKKIATVKGNSKVEYTDKKAYAGQYIYTVRAYSGSKISPYNSKGMTAKTKIATPSNVTASEGTDGIDITWNTVNYASGYKIYRKEAGSSYSLIKTVSGQKSSSYEDIKAESGTAYTYVVRAFRKNSSSNIVTSASSAATASVVYTEPIVVAASDTAETAAAAETGSSEETSAAESENVSESSSAESSVEETSVNETSSESSASDASAETNSEESSASSETNATESSEVSESN